MQIKLELYRVFVRVAEVKNLSAAAKLLFISQSAVSQSIKQLEEAFGLQLFRRTPKGVELTPQGRLMYDYATAALSLINAGEDRLEAAKTLDDGDLRIGASDTISRYLLLSELERFNRLYYKVKLQIVNRTTLEAIELLKSGKIDIAFVNMPVKDDAVEIFEFISVQDIFVGGRDFSLKSYNIKELAELPLILLEEKSNSRRYVDDFFAKNGIKLSPEIELGSHDLLLEFAKIQLGVSCVIREFSKQYLETKLLFELDITPKIPKRKIGIACLKGVSLTPAAKRFIEMCKELPTL